jgi:hypothetical protein
MTAPGPTPQHLGSRRPAQFKVDHPRAIDRYIDFFGDGIATGAQPRARRVTSAYEQAVRDDGADGPVPNFPL